MGPALAVLSIALWPLASYVFWGNTHNHYAILDARQAVLLMCLIYGVYSCNCYGYYWSLSRGDYLKSSRIILTAGLTALILMAVVPLRYGIFGIIFCNAAYILTCLLTVYALNGRFAAVKRSIYVSLFLLIAGTFLASQRSL
jgi:hypothetical protein